MVFRTATRKPTLRHVHDASANHLRQTQSTMIHDRCPRCQRHWSDLAQSDTEYCDAPACPGGDGFSHLAEPWSRRSALVCVACAHHEWESVGFRW